jgi:hypothetical protein
MAGDVRYRLVYRLSAHMVEIVASVEGSGSPAAPLRFILPVISRAEELVQPVDAKTVRIGKAKGTLAVGTDAEQGFEAVPKERTFNLVPGFECVPLSVLMQPGKEVQLTLRHLTQ